MDIYSAGTNEKICHQLGTNPISSELVEWADQVIVMEEKHRLYIQKNFDSVDYNQIKVLDIPDHYVYYQKELIDILKQKAKPILDRLQQYQ